TITAVGSLPRAGIEIENLGAGAEKLAEGAVSALNAPGFDPGSLSSLTGEVTGSAIQGLTTAGLSAEKIIEGGAIESIISGATSGLKKTETSASDAVQALGSIAGSAVSVLSKVGLTSPELQKDALAAVVKSSMSGAQTLAGNSGETLANTMSAVASQAVLALTTGGFESSQIGSAISTIVQTGVSEISKNGNSSASSATNIASKLIEGALSGAGTLIQSGSLPSDQIADVARAASQGAVAGLQSLQTAGIVTGDAVSVFTTSIVSSVSSGLEKSGTDATIVAQAQTGATTVVESEEVQAQIEASAGTAAAVATPTFSVPAGSYASALSVAITTTTTGASIRYTLDGSTPSSTNGTLYSSALAIGSSKTLKAIAYKTGWSNSDVATGSYTVNIPIFAAASTYATGLNPEGLAAGDLNGDGITDLAVGLYNGKGVSFLLGNGNGTFAAKQDISNSPNSAGTFSSILTASIAVGDINADGKADAVWGAWGDNFLSVLTNTTPTNATTLSFANNQPTGYNPGISGPRGVGITDVDADGLKDIVIGEANGNQLIVFLNQSGTVGSFVKYGTNWLWNPDSTVYTGNAHPWMVAVADFNADGKPDVVGGGGFGGIFSVMLNATTTVGSPSFQTANRINTGTALSCSNNSTVSVSDFNGDGRPDVAASCPTAGTDKIAIFINSTAPNAIAASFTVSSIDAGDSLVAVTSGDVNADGKADLVAVANTSPNALYVFRGNGDGTFAAAETYSIGTSTGPGRVLLVDVNADNRPDVVITNGSTNQVTVFLNQTP
ncbi:MAG TPA: FG-GAP-like repeat-containing protein, partial [Oligoflexus sp.]|uniref:FG-GAP-like repeat-containing protein n=1 Tax=Oligoflexus sp. TaxID=1971216 RepID=UPI002D7FAD63